MKTIFFGTSEFGAIVLQEIVRAGIIPALVVTTPDKPAGRKLQLRPSEVKQAALELHIPFLQPETLQGEVLSELRLMAPDLFLVAAYGKILPQELLDIPKQGSLNVHPSLLPKYRGAAPVQAVLLNGDETTGVTVMLMDKDMDHGPILAQREFLIGNTLFTYPELHDKLAEIGGALLAETIPLWIAGKTQAVPQEDSEATYTERLTKEAGNVDWSRPALYIERQVRALQPWPGAYTQGKTLKILKARVLSGIHAANPGKTFVTP
ncbi:MAG: methionyl-tRNA formyltransferase, partial [bacterium]|nr:methionyl-tRNA formyltransferase [bacterium]